jgi:hypothetical protein
MQSTSSSINVTQYKLILPRANHKHYCKLQIAPSFRNLTRFFILKNTILIEMKLGLIIMVLAKVIDVTAETKHGNDGSVSCRTYCLGTWGQRPFGSCQSATNTVDGSPYPCGLTRGYNGNEVTCECSDEDEKIKHGNNGLVSCTQYCQGDWGSRKFESCASAMNTATGMHFPCDMARGYDVKEISCECSDGASGPSANTAPASPPPANLAPASAPPSNSGKFPSQASSTFYHGFEGPPACGKIDHKQHVSVAMNKNYFGEEPHGTRVGACGQCFELTATGYKEDPRKNGAVNGAKLTVIVDNFCPAEGNQAWCRDGLNDAGRSLHFDLYSHHMPEQWKGFYQGGNLLFDVKPIDC